MSEIDYNVIANEVLKLLNENGKALESLPKATSIAGLSLAPVIKMVAGEPEVYQIDITLLTGPTGKTPVISAKVNSVANNIPATVTIAGTDENPELIFNLPSGKDGKDGEKGTKGDKGDKLTFADLSASEIAKLQEPATTAAETANTAATAAGLATSAAEAATQSAAEAAEHPTYVGTDNYVYKWNADAKSYDKTSVYVKGAQGKPLIVLANGNYGNWDEDIEDYVDSGVEAAATIDIENVTVDFTESESVSQLTSGEKIPSLFGKISKWYTGMISKLKGLAFKDKADWNTDLENIPAFASIATSGSYNDLENKPVLFSGSYEDLSEIPANLVQDASYVHTDNDYTDIEKNKLSGIEEGAQKNNSPVHGVFELTVSKWSADNEMFSQTVSNPAIKDGCYVNIILENDSVKTANEAKMQTKPDFAIGSFTVVVEKLPAANINLTYSILS